jgi:hypothetical protein
MVTVRCVSVAVLAVPMGCSASPEPLAECAAKISELERERAEYVEQTTAQLKELELEAEGAALSNQGKFADFMTGIEFRENRIKIERLRCPEATDTVDRQTPVEIPLRSDDAQDR